MDILERHAPIKYKYVRANEGLFMNKEIRKAIMLQTHLLNILNKEKTVSARVAYKIQRNICTNLLSNAKLHYYSNLKPSSITDNKTFWKSVKPLFSEKVMSAENITLVEKNIIRGNDGKVSEILNDFFNNAVKNLNIKTNTDFLNDDVFELDPVKRAIIKYAQHSSILKIKEIFGNQG